MSGFEAGVPGVVEPVVKPLIEQYIPRGLGLLKFWFTSKEILIVGPPRAGKTTLYDYLRWGLFSDEQVTEPTFGVKESAGFTLKMARELSLQLNIKKIVDVWGDAGPAQHAQLAFERKPPAIIIVLDLTKPLRSDAGATGDWLKLFCSHLESRWRAERRRINPLRFMIVVMNKQDKVNSMQEDNARRVFSKILDDELHDARGQMLAPIELVSCALVVNPKGQRPVLGLLGRLAKAFTK